MGERKFKFGDKVTWSSGSNNRTLFLNIVIKQDRNELEIVDGNGIKGIINLKYVKIKKGWKGARVR